MDQPQPAAPDAADPGASGRPPRTMSRDSRRAQIIEATIATLAEQGYARTTLTLVARRAGLSHGLVLFHFESKERLLGETLAFLAEEYRRNWTDALAAAGPRPEDRLAALIAADFAPAVCQPDRLAAWCSFWGEAQSRPLYQEACGEKDADYTTILEAVCAELAAERGLERDAVHVARILRVTIEGVWLDMMTMARPYGRDEALRTVWTGAALCFPGCFGPGSPRPCPP